MISKTQQLYNRNCSIASLDFISIKHTDTHTHIGTHHLFIHPESNIHLIYYYLNKHKIKYHPSHPHTICTAYAYQIFYYIIIE